MSDHRVKGLTFSMIGTYLMDVHGAGAYQRVAARVSPETRELLRAAGLNDMYPEERMQELLGVLYRDIAHSDDATFTALIREIGVERVRKFFSMLLGFASAAFVLRRMPTIVGRLRSGPAEVTVDQEDLRVRVKFENYPFCQDPIYRLVALAECQALVQASTGELPHTRLVGHGSDWMIVEVDTPPARRRKGGKVITISNEM